MNKWLLALREYDLETPVELYALSKVGKNNTVFGVRSGSNEYILKLHSSMVYDEFESIQYEIELLEWLSKADLSFQIPIPILNRNGNYVSTVSDEHFCLIPKFKGIQPDLDKLNHIESIGHALGQLQDKLSERPSMIRLSRSPFIQFFDFSQPYFDPFALTPVDLGFNKSDSEVISLLEWWAEEAYRLDVFYKDAYQQLPHQICHNDITPNNLLVYNEHVHAVLDFEFMTVTPRAYDLAILTPRK